MMTDGYKTYGDHFILYANVRLLSIKPETKIILYINYMSIKKTFKSQSINNKINVQFLSIYQKVLRNGYIEQNV